MFAPKYSLTNHLLNNIAEIERLYGQIEAIRIPKKLELNLKRDNLIKSSYASNRIEGNPLTLPEVTNLLLDDRIPTNRDEKEVVNYFNLLTKLTEHKDKKFDIDLVKDIHAKILEGVNESAGEIRNKKVVIGKYIGEKTTATLKVKHDPPFHTRQEIIQGLKPLFIWAESVENLPIVIKTGVFHHQFVYIHPFEDGNGRACRVLTALLFIKAGYLINKYFVIDDYYDIDKTLYSDKLHTADGGDKTEWLEYYSDGVKYSLLGALDKVKNASQTLSVKDRPTSKEAQVLEIFRQQPEMTSTDLAQSLKVSRQQAHNLLSSLVNKGFLERQGTTKSSFYRLK